MKTRKKVEKEEIYGKFLAKILSSSYLFIIPILLFNFIFGPKLADVGYLVNPQDIGLLGTVELVLRIVIFIIPLFLFFDIHDSFFIRNLMIYIFGVILYFICWILIIYFPEAIVTRSWFVQLGPAYFPIIWLTGLALMCRSYFFIPVSLLFTCVHTISTYLRLRG